ncbi:MAG: hypothetical protein H6862_03190 [Rhodospirillales bacterium]|nr:hypothetical protein [Rhodospirillales bacterium]
MRLRRLPFFVIGLVALSCALAPLSPRAEDASLPIVQDPEFSPKSREAPPALIAEKMKSMVEKGNMVDTVKPYYDIYQRRPVYLEDYRTHRDRLDARRAAYAAPLIVARAAGLNASAAPVPEMVSETASVQGTGVITPGSLSEEDVRSFVMDLKDKTDQAMKAGDVKALNKLTEESSEPSFVLTMKTESYMDGKFAGSGTQILNLGQILKGNEEIRNMSDITFKHGILSVEIEGDEATVKDVSVIQSRVKIPGVGPVFSRNSIKCTDTLRKQSDGALLYERSICEQRADLNKDQPI